MYPSYYDKPEGISPDGQAVLIVIYSTTTLLAIVGNVTVILVLSCSGRSRTDLNSFIINLAASDVTMAIFGIPFSYVQAMLGHWIFARMLCKIVVFMQQVSVTSSIYTLVAIGVDRYYAVVYPMKKRMSKYSSRITIVVIWIVGLSMSVVQLVYVYTKEYPISSSSIVVLCDEWWPRKKSGIFYEFFILTFVYIIPLCVLVFTYLEVARRLWGRHIPGNAHRSRDITYYRSKKKVIKMLAIIVVLFGLCWLPLITLNIVGSFRKSLNEDAFVIGYFCCHWLAMANSFINPIVYGFLNDSFRADLKRFISVCSFQRRGLSIPRTFASSMRTTSTNVPRSRASSSSFSLRSLAVRTGSQPPQREADNPGISNVADLGERQRRIVFGKPRPDVYFN
ncbi:RYamide receptor-like [Glandiceps talaboti]